MRDENTFYFGVVRRRHDRTRRGLGHGQHGPCRDPRRRRPPGPRARRGRRLRPRQGRPRRRRPGRASAARLGVLATTDVDAALARSAAPARSPTWPPATSGPTTPLADVARCLRAGAVVVTPALYALYDHRSAPRELTGPLLDAAKEGGARALRERRRPGLGQRRAAGAGQRAGRHRRRGPLPGDLRLLDLRPARLGAAPGRHGPADGLRAADGGAPASRPWCGAARSG